MPDQNQTERLTVSGVEFELQRRGSGPTLLLLHGEDGREADLPFIDDLAKSYEVVMPSHPGFGMSSRPDWIGGVDDIAYAYLDLLDQLDIQDAVVMGFSLGGWIAAEIATKSCARFTRLILVDPVGIKIGGPYDRDIADIYYLPVEEVAARTFFEPAKGERDFKAMSDEALEVVARNRESLVLFCWDPYLHNPKLIHRLHRITVPTLVVWGENDGIVTPEYGRAYSEKIPNAQFETIAKAGHLPHLEQPKAFVAAVEKFLPGRP